MRREAQVLSVAAVAVGSCLNMLRNQPVLDDGWVIFDNSLIRHLSNVGRFFREPYNVAGAAGNAGLFRPITTLTYALNYAIGGREVLGYHLVSLALHVGCTLMVLLLAERIAGELMMPERARSASTVAALLFAVHPAHVEAVTGMVGRAEELAALGALGCVYLACTRDRSPWRLPLAWLCLAAGVLCKENAAVAPLLLALIFWAWPRAPRSRLIGVAGLLATAVVIHPLLVKLGPGHVGVPSSATYFGDRSRLTVAATMTRVLVEYFRILLWPHPLGVDFYYSDLIPYADQFGPTQAACTALWLAILALGILLRRRASLTAIGILWVFIALLPVSNVIPIGALMAERFLYLPSVGFCFVAGDLLSRIPAVYPRRALVGTLLVACLVLTLRRNGEWRDALTLWEAELVKEPTNPVVNNNLGVEYNSRREYAKARERLEAALATQPTYWRALVNLGIAEHQLGDDDAALKSYARAGSIEPTASSPDYFAGTVYTDRGDFVAAVPCFRRASSKAPLDALAHYWLGRCLYEAGMLDAAKEPLATAAELDPESVWAANLLQVIRQRQVPGSPAKK